MAFLQKSGLVLVLTCSTVQASPHTKMHRASRMGIEFLSPASWKIHQCNVTPNCAEIGPGVLMNAADGELESSSKKFISRLEKTDSGWVKWGRQTQEPAKVFTTKNGTVVYGTGDCLFDDEMGTHLGTCTEILISNGERTVHIDTDALVEDAVVSELIKSIRFLEGANKLFKPKGHKKP